MVRKLYFIMAIILGLAFSSCTNDVNEDIIADASGTLSNSDTETIELKSGFTIKKENGVYSMGDILLSEEQVKLLDETGAPFVPMEEPTLTPLTLPAMMGGAMMDNATRSCAVYPNYNLWAMVRFVYAPEGYAKETQLEPYTKSIIQAALRHWEATTNVRFYNATGQPTHDDTYNIDYPYIYFCNGTGNNSYVGRVGGKQVLHLAPYQSMGIAAHEIGHAIGLYHEQSRNDRDNYVTVNLNNVDPDARSNFNKITKNYYNMGGFDFSSIMLYSSYDFAIDKSTPTMTKKDGSTFIGQRNGLSDGDRRFPNYFYLPYIARSDTYAELDTVMYDGNNVRLTQAQIRDIQAQLNNGNPNPPANGRIENNF